MACLSIPSWSGSSCAVWRRTPSAAPSPRGPWRLRCGPARPRRAGMPAPRGSGGRSTSLGCARSTPSSISPARPARRRLWPWTSPGVRPPWRRRPKAPAVTPLIELSGLTKDFGAFRALDGLDARLPRGSVGLLGPNGAGKSTLVKCLLGLLRPSAGRARLLGEDVARRPLALRRRVGYLPEVDCHLPGLSAVEFVAYAGELSGMPPRDAMTRAHEMLDLVGLADERYRPVHAASTGTRQRVKFAQAIVHDPEVVFLDEPTNGLDPRGREQMLALVAGLARAGVSVVYSSHLLADVERVCSEVLILREGRIIAAGPLEELRARTGAGWELRTRGDEEALRRELRARGIDYAALGPGRGVVRPARSSAALDEPVPSAPEPVPAAGNPDAPAVADPRSAAREDAASPVDRAAASESTGLPAGEGPQGEGGAPTADGDEATTRDVPSPPDAPSGGGALPGDAGVRSGESARPGPDGNSAGGEAFSAQAVATVPRRVFAAAAAAGCEVRRFVPLRSSLEDVFVAAVRAQEER
ncbi:MAG: ATP-binding cassette domain-containing protein [Planctomycetota bacterium]|nr:MAG: ATP-binding cassette domain-containing protein [Planctomycetota bacterium]